MGAVRAVEERLDRVGILLYTYTHALTLRACHRIFAWKLDHRLPKSVPPPLIRNPVQNPNGGILGRQAGFEKPSHSQHADTRSIQRFLTKQVVIIRRDV